MVERNNFYKRIESYFLERTDVPSRFEWNDEVNLFDAGILESFDIPDLIMKIEEISGIEVELSNTNLDSFYTLRSIYDIFIMGN